MPPRDWKLRLEDILEALAKVDSYLDGMTLEAFLGDPKTQDAVIRNFGIIGEAANAVPETVRTAHPKIPWSQMRALRNLVIHEYFGVNLEILWDTVQENFPPLKEPLEEMLKFEE
jgi:uncharacterized protein with HEPN domain